MTPITQDTDPRFAPAKRALIASLGDDGCSLPGHIIDRAIERILARLDASRKDTQ